jgi:exosome complex RNA-binding protein Csl4
MDNDDRQQLRELLRIKESRLRILELQEAEFGIQVPPQVATEAISLRAEIGRLKGQLAAASPGVHRATLRQLRQQALKVYYAELWEQAEDLLIQVLDTNPDDGDIEAKLEFVQKQLDLQAFYQTICNLRDEGRWQAVLKALDDLEKQQTGYPDPQGVRGWAEAQQAKDKHKEVSLTSEDSQQPMSGKDAVPLQHSIEEVSPVLDTVVASRDEVALEAIKVGDVFLGKVVRITPFGAFVNLVPGKNGMIHISELDITRVENVEDIVKIGDEIKVMVIGVEPSTGKVSLSRSALLRK